MDINIGDVVARLRAVDEGFTRGIREAQQRLADLTNQATAASQALGRLSFQTAEGQVRGFSAAVQQASTAQQQAAQASSVRRQVPCPRR